MLPLLTPMVKFTLGVMEVIGSEVVDNLLTEDAEVKANQSIYLIF